MNRLNRRRALWGLGAFAVAAGVASATRAMTRATFMVTIRNVASEKTLKLPDRRTSNAPIAPGVFVVAHAPHVLFRPGTYADEALERLAEDGNFQPLLDKVASMPGLTASGMFVPGQPFSITASPGDQLQFATMFVQSNDLFFAPRDGGIALFDAGGRAMYGRVTSRVALFDAGTEKNQAPGAGADQAPRQARPNAGAIERLPIDLVSSRSDGFAYPSVEAVIDVQIEPAG